ncbi:hypothetical protein ADJ73_01915 [Arsenicicoccus sp. oral taxon 190]|nr:hypothetical protein ADJ73_01915 [Arsenicicoccus sp. oral taxon 190]
MALAGIVGTFALTRPGADDPGSRVPAVAAAGALPGCGTVTPLRITTTDDLAPALRQITARLESSTRDCVDYTVTARSAADAASGLMSGDDAATQVWVPDSSLWAERVRAAAPSVPLTRGPVVATSPVLFTAPQGSGSKGRAGTVAWSAVVNQGVAPLRVATPERSTASLLALLGAKEAVSASPQDSRALQGLLLTLSRSTATEDALRRQATASQGTAASFPASEQQIYAMNQAHPTAQVGALAPAEAVPQLDYPLITVGGPGAAPARAIQALRDGLAQQQSIDVLRAAGFRVGGSAGPGVTGVPAAMPRIIATPRAADADTALRMWVTMSRQTRMLAVIDTSESMKKQAIPGMNRIELARTAAIKALAKFPETSQIGLWSFDLAHPGQPQDWAPLVPIQPLNHGAGLANQRLVLGHVASTLTWHQANGTALHDTIWAGYQELQRSYQPDFANALILLTDGKNEDPSSLTEQQLVANLTRASKDAGRPVRIALIGISQDADLAALQRIAEAVPDGHAYDARQPENIYPIMQEILTTRGLVAPAQ